MNEKQLRRTDYHVAWICPVSDIELLPSRLMLDEEHPPPPYNTDYDDNTYIFGKMAGHNVVLATCPRGMTGNVYAGRLTGSMFKTFPNIKMAMLVGIGGGVPSRDPSIDALQDIHLGDVVVGWPGDGKPACVYYESGRSKVDGEFEILGTVDRPDWALLHAVDKLSSDHDVGRTDFSSHLRRLLSNKRRNYSHPGLEHDRLFMPDYHHEGGGYGPDCSECDVDKLVERKSRTEEQKSEFVFHQGRIATGNSVIQDGELRDRISERCGGVHCIEMEAAGVDATRKCLVIRGISDYADSHKNDKWKHYAAGNAAVFARELLGKIPPATVKNMETEVGCKFIVPFGRNESFVGRTEILHRLLERIPPSTHRDDCQRTVVQGLGGVGKTHIVLEAAYRFREIHPHCSIFWVPALNVTTFENAYREIGHQLELKGIDDDKADVKTLVKTALSRESTQEWLLIVDNADNWDLLFDDAALADYLPFSRRGSLLLTTRNYQVATRIVELEQAIIAVPEMSRTESLGLLKKGVKPTQVDDTDSANKLLEFLTDLPLAIKQASAYIAKTGISASRYFTHCQTSDKALIKLLSKDFEDRGRYKTTEESKNPIAMTWLISFNHISRDAPLAAQYLRFISFLAERNIPVSLLPPGDDDLDMDEAIGTLKAYAFITELNDPQFFDIHRLVRLAMQNWLEQKGEREFCATEVIEQLANVFPIPEHGNRDKWIAYLPHARSSLGFRKDSNDETTTGDLFNNIGRAYSILGKYTEAEQMHRQAMNLSKALLGEEHPDTLNSMNNLASTFWNQGRYEEAELLDIQALEMRKKVLGEEHPDTLNSMNSLASTFWNQGRYEEAEPLQIQALEMRKKVLGEEHPDTLNSMNNLASTFWNQGRYEEAELLDIQALEMRKKVLGEEHPDTLNSMNSLALTFWNQGRYEESEPLQIQALEMRKKVLGEEHPNTLNSMNNLALTFWNQGRYEESESLDIQALEMRKKVLGEEHPDTLNSINNLALTFWNQGRYEEAEPLQIQALEMRKKVLGEEHPDTLNSMNNLALTFWNQGRYEESESLDIQALEMRKKVLGEEHPNTLTIMNNLAHTWNAGGRFADALALMGSCAQACQRVLGPDHPHTLDSFKTLDEWRKASTS